jgi:hypothetical protein
MRKTIEERFWNKVSKRKNKKGCWLWTAGTQGHGYGYFRTNKNCGCEVAHRYSYVLHKGAVPPGMLVLHTCDTPRCVNPTHLFLGTHKENAIDRENKGRGVRNMRKLTLAQVKKIKSSNESQSKLAVKYSVSRRTIASIQYGETWRHVSNSNTTKQIEKQICEICGKESIKTIHIDANWQFRKISDSLCLTCDKALKLLNYDLVSLTKAIDFIKSK